MSRTGARRTFAGFVLAALLLAAPARAADLPDPALALHDVWLRAWSWFADLWTDHSRGTPARVGREKDGTGPPPNPGDPHRPPDRHGESGPGIDPDG